MSHHLRGRMPIPRDRDGNVIRLQPKVATRPLGPTPALVGRWLGLIAVLSALAGTAVAVLLFR